MRISIRWRLTIWYASALAVALAVFGAVLWVSVQRRLLGEMDGELAGRAARFQSFFLAESAQRVDSLKDELDEFCAALPPGSFLELRGPEGVEYRYPAAAQRDANSRALKRAFEARTGRRFEITVGESRRSADHTMALLRIQLIAITPLAILLASIGGWWLSRRALKPVAEIARAAQEISIDNLSLRLETPNTGDELQQLGEAFNIMLARLESAVSTLSQFVADASHELRTPVAIIRASAEIALRRARSPELYREALSGIAAEAERMTALVEDLLFLARSDAAPSLPLQPADLTALVAETTAAMEQLAEARNVRITLSRESQPAFVLAAPGSLKRMFIALLDNAIKNSLPGGEVRVEMRLSGDSALVTVRDFGFGIAPDDLPHIFKRFYRADKSRSSEGHGLGLSIADSIARAHSASIDVVSAPGKGSAFTVRIPLITMPDASVSAAEPRAVPA